MKAGGDHGSITVEAMLVLPVVMMVLLLTVVAGRVTVTAGNVQAAARDVAREASIARTPAEAKAAAVSSANTSLRSSGVRCSALSVQVDVSGFARRVGLPAQVSASVSCAVRLSDLGFPGGMPGQAVKRARAVSPLDRYRARR